MTADPLLHAIIAGDARAVVEALRGVPESGRRERAAALLALADATDNPLRLIDGNGDPQPIATDDGATWQRAAAQRRALEVALAGTASLPEQRALDDFFPAFLDVQRAAQAMLDRDPPWLGEWAQWQLKAEGPEGRWPLVRVQVRAGLIERPPDDLDQLLGTFRLDARELLEDDPDLDVWALLKHHDGKESLRSAQDRGAHWREALIARLDRERLIDAALDALGSDLSAHRAAFYTGLWRALDVAEHERAARHERLRGLLGAAAPNVVGFAVDELLRDERAVPAHELAAAVSARAKKTVRGALRLLDRAPDAATAAIALGHPDAAIQGETLDRIERWGPDRDVLARHVDALAATQRPRAQALLGRRVPDAPDAVPEVDVDAIAPDIRRALRFGGGVPRAPVAAEPVLGAPITPIGSLEELAAELAAVLHEPWLGDERLLDGVLRHCDQPFQGPLQPLVERLLDLDRWFYSPVTVAACWLTGDVQAPSEHASAWELRLFEAVQRAARGQARPLLSLPTHAGGWIESRVFVRRLHDDPDELDLAQALLRLAPDGREHAVKSVRPRKAAAEAARAALAPNAYTVRVVYADGSPEVTVDGPRTRHPGPLREALDPDAHHWLSTFPDWSLWPQRRDIACAIALRHLVGNLDTGSGRDTGVALLLETLLDQSLPPLALRLLIQALGSAYTREHLAATDLLIAGIADGRIDAATLPLDDLGLLKPNRLAARLQSVADAGPLQRIVVRDFLDAAIPLVPKRAKPLTTLHDELRAQTHAATPSDEARLALAARVRRAERWTQRLAGARRSAQDGEVLAEVLDVQRAGDGQDIG
ncbi:DUF6493 family protein [Solirubrobacter taibaiensis]|nr:DUF6493 family protein [Solirubrobacter taibaiensis]